MGELLTPNMNVSVCGPVVQIPLKSKPLFIGTVKWSCVRLARKLRRESQQTHFEIPYHTFVCTCTH